MELWLYSQQSSPWTKYNLESPLKQSSLQITFEYITFNQVNSSPEDTAGSSAPPWMHYDYIEFEAC